MKKIIVASNNEHKIKEFKKILEGYEVVSLKDEGINIDPEETGKTFIENALIKAEAIFNILLNKENVAVLADDSGLEVDYLNGEPGVFSARYCGEHGNDKGNNDLLLKKLEGVPREKRGAAFVCALAFIESDRTLKVEGKARGIISDKAVCEDGFGYDPLFFYPALHKTFAQCSEEEKNAVSHRGEALKRLLELL